MKLIDNKNNEVKVGQKVKLGVDIPSANGMLYKNQSVKIKEFNIDNKKIKVTDSMGKVWWVEPSQVSCSFL